VPELQDEGLRQRTEHLHGHQRRDGLLRRRAPPAAAGRSCPCGSQMPPDDDAARCACGERFVEGVGQRQSNLDVGFLADLKARQNQEAALHRLVRHHCPVGMIPAQPFIHRFRQTATWPPPLRRSPSRTVDRRPALGCVAAGGTLAAHWASRESRTASPLTGVHPAAPPSIALQVAEVAVFFVMSFYDLKLPLTPQTPARPHRT